MCTVGDEKITVDEFVQRVETSPEVFLSESATNAERLNALIDETILAVEAKKAGLDKAPLIENLVDFIEDMAVSRELYQRQVRDAIQIDSSEIDEAVKMSNETRRVSYLYLSDEKTAQGVQQRLTAGETFESVSHDFHKTEADSQIIIKEIRWGEQLEPLEKVIFALQPGQVSGTIKVPSGYMVLKLVDVVSQPIITESEIARKKAMARKIIIARQEERQSGEYVHEFMTGQQVKFNEKLVRPVIGHIANAIMAIPDRQVLALNNSLLTDSLFIQTENSVTPWLEETIVTFRNGKMTLREILAKWRQTRLPVNTGSAMACQQSIAHNFSILVRDALLVREARRLGYAQLPQVKNDCKTWCNYYLSELMTEDLNTKRITVDSYIKKKKDDYTIIIDTKKLAGIQLTDIPLLAVRPGQYHSRVKPPWPDFNTHGN